MISSEAKTNAETIPFGSDDELAKSKPRLGRRESEPHSAEITYLFDVLTHNFPNDRTMWDLHHLFRVEWLEKPLDVQFDVSYFKGWKLPEELPSYKAWEHENRVPTLAINVLSRSTWKKDITEIAEDVRLLGIPIYIVFSAYALPIKQFSPPFLRVYFLREDGSHEVVDCRTLAVTQEGAVNPEGIIDLRGIVPFNVGLMKREKYFHDGSPLYRLAAFDSTTNERLLSRVESAEKRAEKAEKRAEKAEKQANMANKQLEEERKRREELERKLRELERRVHG